MRWCATRSVGASSCGPDAVLLWFAGFAVVAVWLVFRDPAIDLRLVVLGALLPDVIDAPFGGPRLLHSVVGCVLVLTAVMLATVGRRQLRRRLLAVPIGLFLHLVLDGMWTRTEAFWWPAFGLGFGEGGLPSVDRGALNIVLEAAGAAALVWAWIRFRLGEPARRAQLVRTGRVGRDLDA